MTPDVVPALADYDRQITVGSRLIPASPADIFELLADPAKHQLIDGSDTVNAPRSSSQRRLKLGDKFGMNMKMGVPYMISNTVSAFEEGRVIEWHHFGRHRWRYELEAVDGGTRVTETFNWGSAMLPAKAYELVGYPERHQESIDKTLERMEQHFAGRPG